jgi:hypothetical protein
VLSEFQRAAILGDDAHNIIGKAIRMIGADFQRDADLSTS